MFQLSGCYCNLHEIEVSRSTREQREITRQVFDIDGNQRTIENSCNTKK